MENTLILTPSALFTFLSQIEELKDFGELKVEEESNQIVVSIGDSKYVLQSGTELAEVDDEIVDTIEAINDDGYAEAEEEIGSDQNVEGGIIKELIKTLAIGGLVRLTKNAIANS